MPTSDPTSDPPTPGSDGRETRAGDHRGSSQGSERGHEEVLHEAERRSKESNSMRGSLGEVVVSHGGSGVQFDSGGGFRFK